MSKTNTISSDVLMDRIGKCARMAGHTTTIILHFGKSTTIKSPKAGVMLITSSLVLVERN
ncbi:MAG: hypothetical protein J1F40_09195 [Prevotellaceae bacterium]|nr:hypothetical protein [Prevotellaceae bacterium]